MLILIRKKSQDDNGLGVRQNICWRNAGRWVSCRRKRITQAQPRHPFRCRNQRTGNNEQTQHMEAAGDTDFRRFGLEGFGEWLRASGSGCLCNGARRGVCRHGGQSVGHLLQPGGHHPAQGQQSPGGVYGIYLDPSYSPPKQRPNLSQLRETSPLSPQFFYTYTPKNRAVEFWPGRLCAVRRQHELAAGLDDADFRQAGISGSLKYITINPVVAVKLLPSLSVGGGAMVNYGKINMLQGPGLGRNEGSTFSTSPATAGAWVTTRASSGSRIRKFHSEPPSAARRRST